MHPSKTHQSTTRKPDSGLRLGFTDVQATGDQSSGITQQTPTKKGTPDSSFQFTFARPAPQLGPDAQRMRNKLREEALCIKAKLAAEREEEKRKHAESAATGGRKIAQPKGKAGRFSDVHMAEFRKMDSIAGHPSSFRAQSSHAAHAVTNLKRTQSKAQLKDRDDAQKKGGQSFAKQVESERLENSAPAKRARKHIVDDISSARPISRGDTSKALPAPPATPTRQHHQNVVASLITPTQASLARAASTKKPASQIPMLSRSPSRPNLAETPKQMTKPATMSNISSIPKSSSKNFLQSPNKFDRVKSMLRYPSSAKKLEPPQAAARSPGKSFFFEKPLPAVPATPGEKKQTEKHVNFTPEASTKLAAMGQNSPSPMKSGITRSTSKANLGARARAIGQANTAPKEVQYPIFANDSSTSKSGGDVEYPSMAGVRPLPESPRQFAQTKPPTSVPGTFTFRSDHTIDFGRSPKGFGSSPGQFSIRQVRPSFMPTKNKMPGAFPSNKENTPPVPSLTQGIPHGMSNKKRRRVESDGEEDEDAQRLPKKQKAAEGAMIMAPNLQGPTSIPASEAAVPVKKKGVLSLSRLNMLSRPKVRR